MNYILYVITIIIIQAINISNLNIEYISYLIILIYVSALLILFSIVIMFNSDTSSSSKEITMKLLSIWIYFIFI